MNTNKIKSKNTELLIKDGSVKYFSQLLKNLWNLGSTWPTKNLEIFVQNLFGDCIFTRALIFTSFYSCFDKGQKFRRV